MPYNCLPDVLCVIIWLDPTVMEYRVSEWVTLSLLLRTDCSMAMLKCYFTSTMSFSKADIIFVMT